MIPTSEQDDRMHVHVILDEVERVRPNENSEKSSQFTYQKKYANIDISSYNRILNAVKKLDTSYNPTMQNMHEPVIKENYKVTGDTKVIPIVKHKYYEIQWG